MTTTTKTVTVPWMEVAATQIGYKEGPDNANKYGAHYDCDHCPWCAIFGSWCCWKSGHALPAMQPSVMKDGFAAVSVIIAFAKANGLWKPSPEAGHGFGICYGWNGPSSAPADMHFGLIESSGAKGATGHTIEGNRADQVERQTFIVGSDVVLGTVDLPRLLLGRPKITLPAKAKRPKATQPPHPAHPTNTGPVPTASVTVTVAGKTYTGTLPQS